MMKAVDPRTGLELTVSPPPNETPYVCSTNRKLPFAPRLGEHNEEIYGKILGYGDEKLREFHEKRII